MPQFLHAILLVLLLRSPGSGCSSICNSQSYIWHTKNSHKSQIEVNNFDEQLCLEITSVAASKCSIGRSCTKENLKQKKWCGRRLWRCLITINLDSLVISNEGFST